MRDDATLRVNPTGPALDLLLAILGAFHQENIVYCYWKSSRRIPAVLAGESDLDLLVARQDQHRALGLLRQCRFKPFSLVAQRDNPAMLSMLGYDEPSGRIVHVHLHFALVLGAPLFKNYRLPWEASLLARATFHPALPIRMLDPAAEAVLLVLRACLERRRSDPVALRNWTAVTQKFAADRRELAARVDRAEVHARAAELMDETLAGMLADAFADGQALDAQAGLRRRVRARLAAFRSCNAIEGSVRSIGRAMFWLAGGLNRQSLHLSRPWNRRAPGGGIVVAVLGVDGSGKTTVVAALREWLGAEVDVLPIYFGTGGGRPSLLLMPLKAMVPAATWVLRKKPRGSSHGVVTKRPPGPLYSALMMLWAGVLAVEKRNKLLAARRAATRGMVVIGDRYPQDEIPDFNDGPLLHRLPWAPGWLRQFEADAYALARRLPPDLAIKLIATPALIASREPDMDRQVIQERTAAVLRLALPGARVVCVDASLALADVVRAVKAEVWRSL